MVKGVIFDMDGVLVDNMAVHAKVFEMFCEKYGHREGACFMNRFAGMGNEDIMPYILKPEVIEKYGTAWLSAEKERMYREYYADRMVAAPGLTGFMDELKAADIKLAVGSSAIAGNVDFVLDNCNIRGYFDVIVNGDMVVRHKPAPDIFLLAADMLALKPQECLVVEDSLSGIEAARQAGIKVIALTATFDADTLAGSEPDMIVGGFPELSLDKIGSLY